jgi:hypothetical protein
MVKKHKKQWSIVNGQKSIKKSSPKRLLFLCSFEKQLILCRDNVQSDFVFHFFVKVDQC